MQWRAVLTGSTANLNEVNVSYLPQNIAPEILSIQILPTNVGLIANPPIQIDPNIENSGLDPQFFGLPPHVVVAPRRIYQRGARSLLWTAEDRNSDRLVYSIYYREAGEANFKLLRDNFPENFFTVDSLALTDGRYVFRIVAKDSPSNTGNESLSGERISEPVQIDNNAPTVTAVGTPQITGTTGRVVFDATDTGSFIKRAEYSINGGDWQTVYPEDGISDSPRERYVLDVSMPATGDYSVTLRAFDESGNVGNARALIRR
jgi:hypothetical protein